MTIAFRCACGASYTLKDDYAGQILHCPQCGVPSRVGGDSDRPPSLAAPTPMGAPTVSQAPPHPSPLLISPEMLSEEEPQLMDPEMMATPEASSQKTPHDSPRDFEKGMPLSPLLTLILIAGNVIIFFIAFSKGALDNQEAIIQAGALTRAGVLGAPPAHGPEPWRLVSAMFLHGGFDHLFGNCVALYILGMACEHAYGLGRTGLLYLLSGIAGSLLSILFGPGPSVGASGAIFGLMGACIVFFRLHGKHFILRDNRLGIVLLIWALYSIVTGLSQPYIDNGAHIGGLMAGALMAVLLKPAILERFRPLAGTVPTAE